MKPILITSSCTYEWRIHQHHGWKMLMSCSYASLADFDAARNERCRNAARDSDRWSSQVGSTNGILKEYASSDTYAVAVRAALAPIKHWFALVVSDIGHVEATGYDTMADAWAAEEAAQGSKGYDILTADMGNHSGRCSVVDMEPLIYASFDGIAVKWTSEDTCAADDLIWIVSEDDDDDFADWRRSSRARFEEAAESIKAEFAFKNYAAAHKAYEDHTGEERTVL